MFLLNELVREIMTQSVSERIAQQREELMNEDNNDAVIIGASEPELAPAPHKEEVQSPIMVDPDSIKDESEDHTVPMSAVKGVEEPAPLEYVKDGDDHSESVPMVDGPIEDNFGTIKCANIKELNGLTGQSDKLYVTTDNDKNYRWDESEFIEVKSDVTTEDISFLDSLMNQARGTMEGIYSPKSSPLDNPQVGAGSSTKSKDRRRTKIAKASRKVNRKLKTKEKGRKKSYANKRKAKVNARRRANNAKRRIRS